MVPYQGVAPRRGAATTTQRRLLVVDDDDSVRRLLVTVLGEDHEVHAFPDAQALVAAVEAGLDADGAVVDKQFDTTDVMIIMPVSGISHRYINYYGADASRHAL